MFTVHVHVDKRAQAIVFAEVAARVFVTRSAIADVRDRFQSDEGRLFAIGPEAQGFLRRTNRSGFTTMLVNNDLWFFTVGTEARLNEIDFGLDPSHVVLRPPLQYEARAERGKIRNTGNVEEDVLWEHVCKARKNFF